MDVDKVKELIKLMVDNDLLSISLRNGTEEITLRRPNPHAPIPVAPRVRPDSAEQQGACPPNFGPPAIAADDLPATDDNLATIESPMVGTCYAAADPGAAPYVEVGSVVAPDTVVCIIEAMKVFNEIPAEVSGTIEQVLVTNEQAVEFGQPLFLVRPD